jgi:hypothetical protein
MAQKNTQWFYNIPNGCEMHQHFSFQGPPKYTQIVIFGMQTCHLATLLQILFSGFMKLFWLFFREVSSAQVSPPKVSGFPRQEIGEQDIPPG